MARDVPGQRPGYGAALAAVAFIGVIGLLAQLSGVALLLFPELGALAHDVLQRPRGAWARHPLLLVLTPLLAAVAGILISSALPYGVPAILLDVLISVLLIRVLRSPVAPAISAGLLPLVLGVQAPIYPPAISVGTLAIALIAALRARQGRHAADAAHAAALHAHTAPMSLRALGVYLPIIALLATLAACSGLRFILFPPLAVIGYELFAHPRHCPWALRGWRLPLACTLAAAAGVALVLLCGVGALAAMAALAFGIGVLYVLDLHAPPVLAVGLLPLLIAQPGPGFVLAVALGSSLMMLAFAAWRRVLRHADG